jgi:hypothetical protein
MFYRFSASAVDELKRTVVEIDRAIAESEAQIKRSLETIEQESSDIARAKILRDEYVALLGSSPEPLIDTSTFDEPYRVSPRD